MSDDQEIHVEDLCTEKKYFSQIPNIIHRMGLGCYIVAYYCLLKSIAGDKNSCFMSQKTIASLLGCSTKQIRLMNNFMAQPFQILGGKSLIKVTHRKTEAGDKAPNLVQIVDIWVENINALNSKNSIPKTPMPPREKVIKENIGAERSSLPTEPGTAPTEPGTDKEEPSIKTPSKKKDIKDLGLKTEIVHKMNFKNLDAKRRWKLTDQEVETYSAIKSLGITDKKGNALEAGKLAFWAKNFTLDRILDVYHESKAYKPDCMKSYMSSLLDKKSTVPNANAEANRQFLNEYLVSNPWYGVKIFKRYMRYPHGRDYGEIDLNMNPTDFITRLIEKHEQSREI